MYYPRQRGSVGACARNAWPGTRTRKRLDFANRRNADVSAGEVERIGIRMEVLPMKCPKCGVFSPESTERCDCGYTFLTQIIEKRSYQRGHVARRPKWIWAVAGWYGLSVVWSLLSFALIHTGAIPLNAAQQAYFTSLGIVDYLGSVCVGLLSVVGAVQLFRLRKSAVPAFSTALGLNTAFMLLHVLRGSFAEAVGGAGLVGALLGLILLAFIRLYARRLRKQGVLT